MYEDNYGTLPVVFRLSSILMRLPLGMLLQAFDMVQLDLRESRSTAMADRLWVRFRASCCRSCEVVSSWPTVVDMFSTAERY